MKKIDELYQKKMLEFGFARMKSVSNTGRY